MNPTTFSPPLTRKHRPQQVRRRAHWARIVRWASWANLAAVVFGGIFVHLLSERWWMTALLIYMPRLPWMIGALVLIPAACVFHRRSIAVNLFTALVVLVPLMDFVGFYPRFSGPRGSRSERVRLATCHVGRDAGIPSVLAEVKAIVPDLVVLERVAIDNPLLEKAFADWYLWRTPEFFVASKHPFQHLATCIGPDERPVAALFEIDHPHGPFELISVDQSVGADPTDGIALRALVSGARRDELRRSLGRREAMTALVRKFVEEHHGDLPTLVMGDFDSPADGTFFRNAWSSWGNAFDRVGRGYGYTAPCETPWYWPESTPWLRVDHVLFSEHWNPERCWTGEQSESSHRLLGAILHRAKRDD